ncbi:uncharacterized protein LOC120623811 isoform X1 [Pararge aegeria]|uniref:uncharacterized protein LOC120623811 isoform X1 n=1 Tax=Pararge aegeria TaxID=116150 RepID=UPI0019D14899|nr:uncharacterized protein LOC120623811 isoform X1 [Pararge aegeria]XP_039745997.1 uncharacterized protein LOC120623811 isoform X1 [Pararge aegeria]XP_039745998.1 uncharacterized protein LOC120623811 isoform X1 [Pararge aegeria]XP_039745999.1 uncharacterized protein LOC120623811 isoform X1 [Pararge aegeria]
MSVLRLLKLFPSRCVMSKPSALTQEVPLKQYQRCFADTPKRDPTNQVMVHGTEDEARVRVRRARPADSPKVIRFMRENARLAWPGLVSSSNTPNKIILSDYVARILAQGHTLLAEQQVEKRGWSQIRGLALSTSVCPWDAMVLEKWANCMQCTSTRKLMLFTAHCLRAPSLHDKYKVHNILQVILLVPPGTPKCSEVIQMLARNSIKRGREIGSPLMRFDVTEDSVAKALNGLQLKKEYEFNYEVLPNVIKIYSTDINKGGENAHHNGKIITVYTSFPVADGEIIK